MTAYSQAEEIDLVQSAALGVIAQRPDKLDLDPGETASVKARHYIARAAVLLARSLISTLELYAEPADARKLAIQILIVAIKGEEKAEMLAAGMVKGGDA